MNTSDRVWRVDNAAALGAALADFRVRSGVTQAELAAACGLHRPYLSDLERGDVARQVDRLFRVIRTLGLEVIVAKAENDGA